MVSSHLPCRNNLSGLLYKSSQSKCLTFSRLISTEGVPFSQTVGVQLKGGTARAVPITTIRSQPPSVNRGGGLSWMLNMGLLRILSHPSRNTFYGRLSPKNTMFGFTGPLQTPITFLQMSKPIASFSPVGTSRSKSRVQRITFPSKNA